ncbi:UDP-3-O-(3-hydroxymyristoyl)glucosamine N-acyltransferase [Bdellovibrio sp. BCCA]|uniref:UDP-3-O-(3-hydroxymyristoyl)glucosamine N-acyltransferase n=1 Tax=Bdellovibrio sp. BCCA TaxID=3136281 RepID=UPI0030F20625
MKNLRKKVSLYDLAAYLGWSSKGTDFLIGNVAPFTKANEESLTFSSKPLGSSFKGCVIAPAISEGSGFEVPAPRLYYARALKYLIENGYLDSFGDRHDIHPSVRVGQNAVIEDGVVIGENTIIGMNAVIRSNVTIGKNCIIGPNSVIGNRGFGYERDEHGVPIHVPHVGGVIIGDNVDIGALVTVVSGTMEPTMIGNNTKFDDHVHFGHNCSVGESSIITACAEFSGGVQVGNKVWIGPNVSIKEKIKIEDESYVGLASVVLKNVEVKSVIVGNPGRVLRKID